MCNKYSRSRSLFHIQACLIKPNKQTHPQTTMNNLKNNGEKVDCYKWQVGYSYSQKTSGLAGAELDGATFQSLALTFVLIRHSLFTY